ncbi:MAG: hypothetical protein C0506_14095 [Anaerolinea sp.]|nr:hypothetical protein [Anaerolinea sp.]
MVRLLSMRTAAWWSLGLLALAACGGAEPAIWTGPSPSVSESFGAAHCGWEDVRYLVVEADVFSQAGIVIHGVGSGPTQLYAKAPPGVLRSTSTSGPFVSSAALPADSIDTGFRSGDRQLWVSPTEGIEAVFVLKDEKVEKWPRFLDGCG